MFNQIHAAEAAAEKNEGSKGLSYLQKQKYDYLYSFYEDEEKVTQLVMMLDGRGKNAFNSIHAKVEALVSATRDEQRYHDALYDNFDLNETYSSGEIINIVANVRRDLKMEPFSSRLKANCENDFFSLFIIKDISSIVDVEGKSKKVFVGYKPVFKLKPED